MGVFSKLLGRKKETEPAVTVECPHKALVPRWENPEDMGKSAMVSSYTCSACGATFSREEGAALLN